MPAPAPTHVLKPSAGSQEAYWARAAQYFSSAASQVRCYAPPQYMLAAAGPIRVRHVVTSISELVTIGISSGQSGSVKGLQHQPTQTTQPLESDGSKPWQHVQGTPDSHGNPEVQPEPAGRSTRAGQQSAYPGTEYEDIPSQAAMAAKIYSKNPMLPEHAAQGVPKPGPKAAALSKWVPFHAVPKPTAARPTEASGATYLTPSEVQAIGG